MDPRRCWTSGPRPGRSRPRSAGRSPCGTGVAAGPGVTANPVGATGTTSRIGSTVDPPARERLPALPFPSRRNPSRALESPDGPRRDPRIHPAALGRSQTSPQTQHRAPPQHHPAHNEELVTWRGRPRSWRRAGAANRNAQTSGASSPAICERKAPTLLVRPVLCGNGYRSRRILVQCGTRDPSGREISHPWRSHRRPGLPAILRRHRLRHRDPAVHGHGHAVRCCCGEGGSGTASAQAHTLGCCGRWHRRAVGVAGKLTAWVG